VRGLFAAVLLLAACAAPEPPAPEKGILLKDYARQVAGRSALGPDELVPALREAAGTHKDSPERLLRAAYFLLELWPGDADWGTVRPALLRSGATQDRQWATGSGTERGYRIEFVAVPSAWVSPGGHRYDLVVSADLKFEIAKGRQTRSLVRDPEASLHATINRDRAQAANEGGYPSDSCFRRVLSNGAGDFYRFVRTLTARYRWYWDRWADLSAFGFEVDAEFVDHLGGQFETSWSSSGAASTLDPPMDGRKRVRPGEVEDGAYWSLLANLGSRGSSSIGEGHGFVRQDEPPRSEGGC
jgi:hypothetical protein